MPFAVELAVRVGPGQSGPIGLLVVVVLCVACVVLFRSMTKQLRRVPRSFDTPDNPPAAQAEVIPPDGRAGA